MTFTRLDISNFRNLISAKLDSLSQGINLFYGHNGSGKTSLLEAIYYLNLGRSFRGTKADRIINNTAEKLSIFAHLEGSGSHKIPVGIEREQNGEVKIRIAGNEVNILAELAQLAPVLLINSHCHHLIDAGPVFRRRYLDWGSFYQSNEFLRLWRRVTKSLQQRNAALRGQISRKELDSWTKELIDSVLLWNQIRCDYINQLQPVLQEAISELLNISGIVVSYQQGWSESLSYQEALVHSIDRDLQLGYTQMGPHKADLKITVDGVPAKDILSRGQQKLFVCAMILAQGTLLHRYTNKRPIYLIDDLPAELDLVSRSKLMAMLLKQKAQVFVTTVERETLESFLIQSFAKVFHVEHGDIKEMAFNQCVEKVEY